MAKVWTRLGLQLFSDAEIPRPGNTSGASAVIFPPAGG
jgi:hypothetical protein